MRKGKMFTRQMSAQRLSTIIENGKNLSKEEEKSKEGVKVILIRQLNKNGSARLIHYLDIYIFLEKFYKYMYV